MSANNTLVWDHDAIKKHKLFGVAKLSALGTKGFTRGRGSDEKRDDEYARVAEAINTFASEKGLPVSIWKYRTHKHLIYLSILCFVSCRASRRCPCAQTTTSKNQNSRTRRM